MHMHVGAHTHAHTQTQAQTQTQTQTQTLTLALTLTPALALTLTLTRTQTQTQTQRQRQRHRHTQTHVQVSNPSFETLCFFTHVLTTKRMHITLLQVHRLASQSASRSIHRRLRWQQNCGFRAAACLQQSISYHLESLATGVTHTREGVVIKSVFIHGKAALLVSHPSSFLELDSGLARTKSLLTTLQVNLASDFASETTQ